MTHGMTFGFLIHFDDSTMRTTSSRVDHTCFKVADDTSLRYPILSVFSCQLTDVLT
jgi:hypothetical protein